MTSSRSGGKKWIVAVLLVLAAVLAVGAALLIVGGRGLSARYDDISALLISYDIAKAPALTVEGDGVVRIRLTREDIYWYARRYGLLADIRRELKDSGVDSAGFRIADGKLTVFARYRTWGFLPLSYQSSAALGWDGGIALQTEKLSFGNHLTIPRSRWPERFARPYVIGAERISPLVRDAYLDGDALVLVHEGLADSLTGSLRPDAELLHSLDLFALADGADANVAAFVRAKSGREISPAELREFLAASPGEEAMISLLVLSEPETAQALWADADMLTKDMLCAPLLREVQARREELDRQVAAEKAKYEKLLMAVRESYKSGGLAIAETGFVNRTTGQPYDLSALSLLSVSPTDCRIVFLWGSRGGEFCSRDMPPVSEIARAEKNAMKDRLNPDTAYDLGVALSTGSGVPLLLYRRADDSFVLREIGQTQFVALLVEPSIPVLDTALLPEAGEEIRLPVSEGWSGAVILPGAEQG